MDDAARREWLLRVAASGALGGAGLVGFAARALAAGDLGGKQGVVRLQGTATVAGKPAREGTTVKLGDRVATGADSQAVIVLDKDAFLMRSNTVIETTVHDGVLANLLVSTGKVLSVFSKKPLNIKAASATIGIRGTGCYLEVDDAGVYFCLCYGEATVDGPKMAEKNVKTTHHESPLLLTESGGIMEARPGGFKNHTDAELVMLEALVGREPPFVKSGAQYPAGKY